jgi:hypothetical protein
MTEEEKKGTSGPKRTKMDTVAERILRLRTELAERIRDHDRQRSQNLSDLLKPAVRNDD